MTKQTPLLEIKNLSKNYGSQTALQEVDLSIYPGQCLALLGPNGAGKTTLCEIAEGLITPSSGSVSFEGKSFPKDKDAILQSIGVQLQETNLYKKYTVEETIALFASFYPSPASVETLIESLDLKDHKKKRIEALSGGLKQRVYLACALVNQPKILFLDEPTTGLDPRSRRDLWDYLLKLKKEGKGILLTSHYMEEAEHLADTVAIINKGKIVAKGSPKELIQTHCGTRILTFQLASKDMTETNKTLMQQHLSWFKESILKENGFWVAIEDPISTLKSLFDFAAAKQMEIRDLALSTAGLEDVFIKLTAK